MFITLNNTLQCAFFSHQRPLSVLLNSVKSFKKHIKDCDVMITNEV